MRFMVGLFLGGVIGYVVGAREKHLRRVVARRRGAGSEPETLTRAELYERAQAADIPGRSTMTKEELRVALAADEPSLASEIVQAVSGGEPGATGS